MVLKGSCSCKNPRAAGYVATPLGVTIAMFSMLGLGDLVLKLTLTQYYKPNLFKQNLLINYKNTSPSQSSGATFSIILLPVFKMVYSHVSIYNKHHRIS